MSTYITITSQITLTLHTADGAKDASLSVNFQQAQAEVEDPTQADISGVDPVINTTDLDVTNIAHLIKKHGPLGALKHVISYGENVGIGATTLSMTAISISRHQVESGKESAGDAADKNRDSSLRIFMAASKSAAERHKIDKQALLQFVRKCILFKVRRVHCN